MNKFTKVFSRIWGVIKPFRPAKLNPVINAGVAPQQALYFGNSSQNLAPIKVISKAALIDILKEPNFVLFDVRRPEEVEWGMIPSAVNIPLGQLHSALKLDDQKFKAQYGFPKPSKDQKIIFYCQAGSRSQTACELASAMGYENVFNYEGSWSEWSSS